MNRQLLIIITLWLSLLVPGWAVAETDVSGVYQAVGGDQVRIRIQVSEPAPMAFIVRQYLPPGVQLLSASPKPMAYKKGKGMVKWLFTHARAGGLTLSMRLSQPVPTKRLRGEISFRHPASGAMITKHIR
ncbi:hypothetical protein [Desulfogranum mediterraneum]|uniref:hypothetical protein n=1 Tax=Desulfogranum mediterraneum TaxID=160661 RepID=UPI000409A2B9|nr:hypothetical protein [Desulfogranum mediterraneum]